MKNITFKNIVTKNELATRLIQEENKAYKTLSCGNKYYLIKELLDKEPTSKNSIKILVKYTVMPAGKSECFRYLNI